MMDEIECIRRAQAGEAEAFAVLVELHGRFVYNLALRVTGEVQEAEDLAQEASVRAWMALPNFRGQAKFRTWMYRIVTNLCYNRLPGLRRELDALGLGSPGEDCQDEPQAIESPEHSPDRAMEIEERRVFIHHQIDRLPESYRLLVHLRYQQDLTYEEIAGVLNLPLGTVKTGLFRAKERLRQALKVYEEEEVWVS